MDIQEIKQKVENQGFYHLRGSSQTLIDEIISSLGRTLYVTDIVEIDNGRILHSSHQMFMHTDYPIAHYVCWHCIQSAEIGGETMMIHIPSLFDKLPSEYQKSLKEIELKLNFMKETETYPFFKDDNFFYSPSLLTNNYTPPQQLAVEAFKRAVLKAEIQELKLESGDFLVLDNTKYLHGRRAFDSESKRYLKRFLIKDDNK